MSAIKNLYGNNIQGSEFNHSKEWHKMVKKHGVEYEKLLAMLNKEQQEQFDKWQELNEERHSLEKAELYEYAIAVGISLGYESKKIMEE